MAEAAAILDLRKFRDDIAGNDEMKMRIGTDAINEMIEKLTMGSKDEIRLSCDIIVSLMLSKKACAAVENLHDRLCDAITDAFIGEEDDSTKARYIILMRVMCKRRKGCDCPEKRRPLLASIFNAYGALPRSCDEVVRYFSEFGCSPDCLPMSALLKTGPGFSLLERNPSLIGKSGTAIKKVEKRFRHASLGIKLSIIRILICYYKFSDPKLSGVVRRVLKMIDCVSLIDSRGALIELSRLAKGDRFVQSETVRCGVAHRVCDAVVKDSSPSEESIFALHAMSDEYEDARKLICRSGAVEKLARLLESKSISGVHDSAFLSLICVFRSLSKSSDFLKLANVDTFLVDVCIDALASMTARSAHSDADSLSLIESGSFDASVAIENVMAILSNFLISEGYKSYFQQRKAIRVVARFVDALPFSTLFLMKNFVYDCSWNTREHFLSEIDDDFFGALFRKRFSDRRVPEQLFNLIRNLFCESDLLPILRRYPSVARAVVEQCDEVIAEADDGAALQMLYVLANMSTNEECRAAILGSVDLGGMCKRACGCPKMTTALIWLITNLTWEEYPDYAENVLILRRSGVDSWLREIQAGGCENEALKEKIKAALQKFVQ